MATRSSAWPTSCPSGRRKATAAAAGALRAGCNGGRARRGAPRSVPAWRDPVGKGAARPLTAGPTSAAGALGPLGTRGPGDPERLRRGGLWLPGGRQEPGSYRSDCMAASCPSSMALLGCGWGTVKAPPDDCIQGTPALPQGTDARGGVRCGVHPSGTSLGLRRFDPRLRIIAWGPGPLWPASRRRVRFALLKKAPGSLRRPRLSPPQPESLLPPGPLRPRGPKPLGLRFLDPSRLPITWRRPASARRRPSSATPAWSPPEARATSRRPCASTARLRPVSRNWRGASCRVGMGACAPEWGSVESMQGVADLA